jgi:Tetratricopeptide repeat
LTIAEDLGGLAPTLGVPAGADQEETAAAVRAVLQQRDRWLLVFDNAPDPQTVRGWLPDGPGHVLITSRDRGWASLGTQLDIDRFDRAESVAHLRTRLGRDDPDADALAEALGDLPLALAQAAAYLDEHGGLSVAGYLTLYRDREAAGRLLARRTGDGYPESVATTWLIHLTDLATGQPVGLELLRLCAHLDPDDIDLTLLLSQPELLDAEPTRRLAAAARTPDGAEDAIGALTRTSLLDRLDDHRVRIHRLVADITRRHLSTDPADGSAPDGPRTLATGTAWAAQAVGVLAGLFPEPPWEPATWPICARLAAHARTAADHATTADAADHNTGMVLGRLGQYLEARAEYTQARATLARALAIKEAVYGPDHPEVAVTLGNLGPRRLSGDPVRLVGCRRRRGSGRGRDLGGSSIVEPGPVGIVTGGRVLGSGFGLPAVR